MCPDAWRSCGRRSAKRSRLCADPGRSIVAASFGDDVLPVAAGTVILDALYANPLHRRPAVSRSS